MCSTTTVVKKLLRRRNATGARLTALQLEVFKVLWRRSEATVVEIQRAISTSRPLAQTTIATLLSRLEKRGLVAYRTAGRQYVYRAVLQERDARRNAVAEVSKGLFAGDITAMVSQLLSAHELRPGDLARVRSLIDEKEQELQNRKRS